jgi:hypothetical protein
MLERPKSVKEGQRSPKMGQRVIKNDEYSFLFLLFPFTKRTKTKNHFLLMQRQCYKILKQKNDIFISMGKEGAYPSGAPKDPLTDGAFVLNIPAVLSG